MTATPDEAESAEVDEAGRESFPASDPPASWAGPDVIPDEGDESDADSDETDASRPSGDR
jgi:hypothetical protein